MEQKSEIIWIYGSQFGIRGKSQSGIKSRGFPLFEVSFYSKGSRVIKVEPISLFVVNRISLGGARARTTLIRKPFSRARDVQHYSRPSESQFDMGSSSSKAAKTAVGAARRQYPQRVPPPPTSNAPSAPPPPTGQPAAPGPTVHPQSQASETKDESTRLSRVL